MTENEQVPPADEDRGDRQNTHATADIVAAADSTVTAGQGTVDLCRPANLNEQHWAFVPLKRKTETTSRKTLVKLPEKLGSEAPPGLRRWAELYWSGRTNATWEMLHQAAVYGWDVGLLPWHSRLVVLDLDVKRVRIDPEFSADGGTLPWDQLLPTYVTRHGVNDLRREVEALGHTMAEIATYAVRTKSGGFHLYYRANPRYPLTTKHHRDGWAVDVIATRNNWVAAPPTEGYEVVNDLPVIELPDWLAAWLRNVNQHLKPCGGERAYAAHRVSEDLKARVAEYRREVHAGNGDAADLAELARQWVEAELEVIRIADQYGGWNQAIYNATWNLLEFGWPLDKVERVVLDAAGWWDDNEKQAAKDTIASAWNGYETKVRGNRD